MSDDDTESKTDDTLKTTEEEKRGTVPTSLRHSGGASANNGAGKPDSGTQNNHPSEPQTKIEHSDRTKES